MGYRSNLVKILIIFTLLGMLAAGFSHAQSTQVNLKTLNTVKSIHFFGNTSITQKEIASALPFLVGDDYKSDLAEVSKKAVIEYYNKRGFLRATAKVGFEKQNDGSYIAGINVDEGPACIIRSVTMEDPPGFDSKFQFLKFKSKMFSAASIEEGSRYDEDVLTDKLRRLREWLVSQDYLMANTDRISLSFNDDFTAVDVFAKIDFGDRVTFGYSGNTVFTRGELHDFITDLRNTGLGNDYVGFIQRKFADEYKQRAYNGVQMKTKVTEKDSTKHVTFIFNEGVRTKIDSIRWDGLSTENMATAEKIFQEKTARLVQRGFYVESAVDKAVDLFLEEMKSRGYLSVKLVAKTVHPQKKKDKNFNYVSLGVQIAEGEQTIVRNIEIAGNEFIDSEEIKNLLSVKQDEPFNPFKLEEGLQKVAAKYVGAGYLTYRMSTPDASVVRFTANGRIVDINVKIEEGRRIKVDGIHVDGLKMTRQYVVDREIEVEADDWWESSKIQSTETNLRKLGIFSEVRIRPQPSDKGPEYRTMLVEVVETEPGAFEAGPGFRSDLGIRAFSRLSYTNFFGKNWIGAIGAEGNRRVNDQYRFIEYQLNSSFIEPRFFGSKYLYSAGASWSKSRFPPDFNASTAKFSTGFERKFLDDRLTAKLYYKFERVRQFDVFINGVYSEIDNQQLFIGSMNPSLSYDTRDSPFTTTRGQVTTLALEYAEPAFAGQTVDSANATGYYKWTGGTHWYFPITKDIVWSNVVAGGFERSNIANRPIPLIKLFRLGGYGSIRGYAEDTINVDAISIKGTLTYLNLRSQIDLPFVGDLKFAPFIDAGNLYVDEIRASPFFKTGAGAGLHYLTPIGPINLDYGFKINPQNNELPSQVHFSVGFI